EIFESMPVPQALRVLAVPMVISQLIGLIYNMADTFYVGRTNDPYMVAGISMMLPVFNITLSLAGISGVGGGMLISRLLGRGQEQEARRVSVFSIYLAISLAAVFSVGMLLFMDPLLKLVGAGENTIVYARHYIFCVLVIGGIPTVLSNVLSNLIRCVGYSKKASFGIALGGVLNIALDPLFMFVLLPDGYQVLGVGIATCISNCTACVYFLSFLYRSREQHVITLNPREGMPQSESIRSVLEVGIPSSVTVLLFDLDYVVLDRLMVAYGDIPLAAIGIVLKVERFPLNVGIGICQGMVPLVAYNFSSGNHERMDSFIHFARKTGMLVGLASICVYELFAAWLMRFFISEAQTVQLGTAFIRARILATPMMFLCFSMVHVFNALGDGRRALFLGVMRWVVINIPMLFILNAFFGMYGLVWSQLVSDSIMAAISFCVFDRYRKSQKA
ncbi:MAG: polysaccharide biosynthesis C-terminal domain-containing protein, partial [Lachnospiraceae bacterium]|nr:polysaccharide biosynthesis C-terminal domain-containing protein [Lachnospiraceae bacterium]